MRKGIEALRRQVEHRVLCKSCGESFNTGEALQLRRTGKVKEEMREVILGVVESLHTVSSGIDRTKLLISSFYSRLFERRGAPARLAVLAKCQTVALEF